MSLVRLHKVSKRYDSHLVLRDIYFRLSAGERVGLIGKNGAGKTTVLKLILGQEEPTEGTVDITQGVRIGYFSQFSELDGRASVTAVLDEIFGAIHAIEGELLEIEGALEESPQGETLNRLLHRQAALLEEMNRQEGWTYKNRIDTVLTRLGFSQEHRIRPIGQLSGGWGNRAALAKILLEEPDVLLLDEPTNYLDMDGLAWLEEWLLKFWGALLVVSHDRDFLEHVVNRIAEIENYHFQEYEGGFTQYVRQKRLRIKTLQRQFQHEEELLAFESEAIADRREMLKDPSAALKRKLANIKKSVEPRPVDKIITRIYEKLYVPKLLCRAERIAKAYDEQVLFSDLTFEIHRGDRFAVIGPNGCGKTTLIKTLTGLETPDEGKVDWFKGVEFADYNQIFAELDPSDTLSHAINVVGLAYFAPRKQVHRFLSLMQFTEMDLKKPIGSLSCGQKARVALAHCLLSGAGVILLDEPTNHLDLPSAQVMERALLHFPGAVVVASHDRFFIDKVANRLLIFQGQGHVQEVNGNWTIYQIGLQPASKAN